MQRSKWRRSRASLEANVSNAKSRRKRALALYRLALFHDNNSREEEAIPIYARALKLGLPHAIRAEALAWSASSLYKTGKPRRAMQIAHASMQIARDPALRKFLKGLQKRIAKALLQ
jgi:Tetratrico peptide repeat